MDGIHDLGGMAGFGPVPGKLSDGPFHHRWEAQAYALNALGIVKLRAYNTDEYRHAIERIAPAEYLRASYYERVLTGVATLLVEKGVLGLDDLGARAGAAFPLSRPLAERPPRHLDEPPGRRFQPGDLVRVRDIHPAGHTRVPRYVRGKRGRIIRVAPAFSVPDAAAHGLPRRMEPTYHVEFPAAELWPDDDASDDSVVVDLWDCYLERT